MTSVWPQTARLHICLYLYLYRNSTNREVFSVWKRSWGFPQLSAHLQQSPPKIYNYCSLLINCSTRGASLLDFPLLVLKNNPSLQLLGYFLKGEWRSRSGGIWEASTALCLHVPVALTLDTGGLSKRGEKRHPHCSLLNVSILSTHLRAMFGPYLPFVYYWVSSLVHLTGDSVFPPANGFC